MARASGIDEDLRIVARRLPALERTERRTVVRRALHSVEDHADAWEGTRVEGAIAGHVRALARAEPADTPDLQAHLNAIADLLATVER